MFILVVKDLVRLGINIEFEKSVLLVITKELSHFVFIPLINRN